jgi:hypothetical protein
LAANRPGNGPYSKLLARGSVSGRSRNGRFLAAAREQLTEHLGGGQLSAAQRILVERVAWLMLHVALFDEKVATRGGPMSDRDRASYLAFSNSLVRATRDLGLDPAAAPVPTLDDHIRMLVERQVRSEVAAE